MPVRAKKRQLLADIPTHMAATRFLRVTYADWPAVRIGEKRQIRLIRSANTEYVDNIDPPAVTVCYAAQGNRVEHAMFVVEKAWLEPVGAISRESLEIEGFADMDEYRAYWWARNHTIGYRPTSISLVIRLRPWSDEDQVTFGVDLLRRLYGHWLPDRESWMRERGELDG